MRSEPPAGSRTIQPAQQIRFSLQKDHCPRRRYAPRADGTTQNIAQLGCVSTERATKRNRALTSSWHRSRHFHDMMGKAAAGNLPCGTLWNRPDESASLPKVQSATLQGWISSPGRTMPQPNRQPQQLKKYGGLPGNSGRGCSPWLKLLLIPQALYRVRYSYECRAKGFDSCLIILNALVVKHTLAIMSQKAAFAACLWSSKSSWNSDGADRLPERGALGHYHSLLQ